MKKLQRKFKSKFLITILSQISEDSSSDLVWRFCWNGLLKHVAFFKKWCPITTQCMMILQFEDRLTSNPINSLAKLFISILLIHTVLNLNQGIGFGIDSTRTIDNLVGKKCFLGSRWFLTYDVFREVIRNWVFQLLRE